MHIISYPPVGSKWEVTHLPNQPRTIVTIVGGGHGNVVFHHPDNRHLPWWMF